MEGPPAAGDQELALQVLMDRYPDGAMAALDDYGSVVGFPRSLPIGEHPLLEGHKGLDLFLDRDRLRVTQVWLSVRSNGAAAMPVHLPDGSPAMLFAADCRKVHGVIVILVTRREAEDAAAVAVLDEARVAPRAATLRLNASAVPIEIDDATVELFEWTFDELAARDPLSLIHPDDHEVAISFWIDVLSNPGRLHRYRGRFLRRDGSWRWIEFTSQNRLDDPAYADVLSERVDVSAEVAAQEALQAREEMLYELTQALPSGVMQVNRTGEIEYANDRLAELVGCKGATTLLEQLAGVVEEDVDGLVAALTAVLELGESQDLRIRIRRDGDEVRVCALTMRPLRRGSTHVTGAIACVDDVTESSRMHAELEVRATYDTLTGCYNRASIMAMLDVALDTGAGAGAGAGPGSGTAAIFIDLDHFKQVNDRFGHAAGDRLLVVVAARLHGAVRVHDTVGRLGGDEFLVVCPGIDRPELAMMVAERIADQVVHPIELGAEVTTQRASIGVAWVADGETEAELLVARADLAMYESKRRGDGRPARWTDDFGAVPAT